MNQQLEELEKTLLSEEVGLLDAATWASQLREYFELREQVTQVQQRERVLETRQPTRRQHDSQT